VSRPSQKKDSEIGPLALASIREMNDEGAGKSFPDLRVRLVRCTWNETMVQEAFEALIVYSNTKDVAEVASVIDFYNQMLLHGKVSVLKVVMANGHADKLYAMSQNVPAGPQLCHQVLVNWIEMFDGVNDVTVTCLAHMFHISPTPPDLEILAASVGDAREVRHRSSSTA
jgi:hypothetical protein